MTTRTAKIQSAKRSCWNRLIPVAASFLMISFLGAQETEEDEVFELSPFEVSVDDTQGYLATNSTSGTRFAVEIRDLPMSLEVITSQQLTDQGATDFKSAIEYSAGIFATDSNAGTGGGANAAASAELSPSARAGVGNFRNNAVSIRGFNTPFQLRNGFRIGGFIPSANINLGGVTNSISMERLEIVKGPQSLLYGLSVLSGIANIIPKTPLATEKYFTKMTVGSHELVRFELDATGPVAGGLNYRAFASVEQAGSREDFRESEDEYYGFQLEQRLLDNRLKLFGELQYARQFEHGIGSNSVRDSYSLNENTNIWTFKNEFGEFVDWQRDPNYGNLDDDRSYNLGGPDATYSRKELNLMLDGEFKPFKQHEFRIKVGAMYGEQDIDEHRLIINTQTYDSGTYTYFDAVRFPGLKNDIYSRPELVTILPNPGGNSGEVLFPFDLSYPIAPVNAADVTGTFNSYDEYKGMYYFFEKRPTDSENLQVRTELSYIVDSPWLFRTNAQHSFLLGRLDIEDVVDYVGGSTNFADLQWGLEPYEDNPIRRQSVLDTTPIHYDGAPYPVPGASYRQIKTWFTGHYFAYNGSWFNDRLNVILGVRRDTYQTWEGTHPTMAWRDPDFNAAAATTPDDLREQFNPDWDPYNPLVVTGPLEPRGGVDGTGYAFESRQEEDTKMGAISYRITDSFSIYGLYGEGISPNTGLKDGAWDAIEAERTQSQEIGLKFELYDRKISGSIAFWKIQRENVIWETEFAPYPAEWLGGKLYEEKVADGREPDPVTLYRPDYPSADDPEISYWVNMAYFDELGVEPKVRRIVNGRPTFVWLDGIVEDAGIVSAANTPYSYVLVEPNKIPEGDPDMVRQALENAFNADYSLPDGAEYHPSSGVPIFWRTFYQAANNPSMRSQTGVNVTMEDESRGVDLNLILSPVPNWQIILNYSYIEREVTSPFNLVPNRHPVTGENIGTEYDVWVYYLGRESFEDPSDATTLTKGLKGLSLFFAPQHSATAWSKYTFREGPLENLEFGIGLKYISEAQTSIPIGGTDARLNPYRTPPVPERITFDGMLAYRWDWKGLRWKAQLNIYNLANDTESIAIASYTLPEGDINAGEQTQRRTRRYYNPTSFRLSLGVNF